MAEEIIENAIKDDEKTPSVLNLCQEYKDTIQLSLMVTDYNLNTTFEENYDSLDILSNKIEVYLLKMQSQRSGNGTFRQKSDWNLTEDFELDDLQEFEDIKVSLRMNVQKIMSKIQEIEDLHKRLIENVQKPREEGEKKEVTEMAEQTKTVEETGMAEKPETAEVTETVDETEAAEETRRNHKEIHEMENQQKTEEQQDEFVVGVTSIPAKTEDDPKAVVENFKTSKSEFSKASCLDLVTMCQEIRSDVDVEPLPLLRANTTPAIMPDVTRRRAFQDIHQKLVDLDASDSLESFNVLMSRKTKTIISCKQQQKQVNKKTVAKQRLKRAQDDMLKEKYVGSVWFFQKKPNKYDKGDDLMRTIPKKTSSNSHHHHSNNVKKKSSHTMKQSVSTVSREKKSVTKSRSLPTPESPKVRLKPSVCQSKLRYYDLLDDLNVDDLKPFESEYPRKDGPRGSSPLATVATTDDDNKWYLSKMLESQDNIWKQLIVSPKIPLRNRGNNNNKNITMMQKRVTSKTKNVKNLMNYLTGPQRRVCTEHNVIVMPVKCYYDNFPTKQGSVLPPGSVIQSVKDDMLRFDKRPFFVTDLTRPRYKGGDCGKTKISSPSNRDDHASINVNVIKKTPRVRSRSRSPRPSIPPTSVKTPSPPPLPAITKVAEPLDMAKVAFTTGQVETNTVAMANTTKQTAVAMVTEQPKNPATVTVVMAHKQPTVAVLPSQSQMMKKRKMLEHLKGLKVRNDNIQKNIKKAIDVIETKMIDILSSPSEQNNDKTDDAFIAMENEITNVLKLMNEDEKCHNVIPEKDEPVTSPPLSHAGSDNLTKSKKHVTIATNVKNKKCVKSKLTNMADSERLLGQVDNVVKKIDDIYTKFYDKSTKPTTPDSHSFNNVIDFLDNIKNLIEDPPILVHNVEVVGVANLYHMAKVKGLAHHVHDVTYEFPPLLIDSTADTNHNDGDKMTMGMTQGQILDTTLSTDRSSDWSFGRGDDCVERRKHADEILTTFYAIFFSVILATLNLDFTC